MSEVIPHYITGDWRHLVEDGMVDHDPLPDEVLPTGHVLFEPIAPRVAVAGTPATAYTLGPDKALIAGGVLTDMQGREGIWLTGQIGGSTVRWRATVHLEFRGEKIAYPTIDFDLTEDVRLTGLIQQTGPHTPFVIDPRIEDLAGRLADVDQVVSDAEQIVADAGQSVVDAGLQADRARDEADRAIGLAHAQDEHIAGTLEDETSETHAAFKRVGNATYGAKAEVDQLIAQVEVGLGARTENRDLAVVAGSSTIAELSPHLRNALADRGVTLSSSYTARGGWTGMLISAGLGTRPLSLDEVTIPASGPVTVSPLNLTDTTGVSSSLVQYLGSLAGVPGILSCVAGTTEWTFTRDTDGDPVAVASETPFVPSVPITHRNALAIINYGKNSITKTVPGWDVPRLVDLTESAANQFGGADGRVLAMGHFLNTGTATDSAERTRIETYNDAMASRYGDRFFDLAGYVASQEAWAHVGVMPTQADIDEQALGNLPPSLSRNFNHLSAAAYEAVCAEVMAQLEDLGWVSAPNVRWKTVAFDDFNRPDGPLTGQSTAGGMVWEASAGNSAMVIADGRATRGIDGASTSHLDPMGADQRVTATVSSIGPTPADRRLRLLARSHDSFDGYFLAIRAGSTAHGVSIWRGNGPGNVTRLAFTVAHIPEDGDVLALEVIGDTLVAYLNGTEVLRVTDSTYVNGKAGIHSGSAAGDLDDFRLEVAR